MSVIESQWFGNCLYQVQVLFIPLKVSIPVHEENTQNEYRYKSSEVDAYSLLNKRVV